MACQEDEEEVDEWKVEKIRMASRANTHSLTQPAREARNSISFLWLLLRILHHRRARSLSLSLVFDKLSKCMVGYLVLMVSVFV